MRRYAFAEVQPETEVDRMYETRQGTVVNTDPVVSKVIDTKEGGARLAAASAVVRTSKAKVLIVDDETDIVASIARRLVHAGYEVESAGDGARATQVAIQSQPDLIVLDIGMPCGDGHTVAERLRSNVRTMFTPIIYLTARTSDIDRAKAFDSGAFAYITKPFKSEELLDLIEKALSSR
jgi:CheY-like chemotaxis protein